MSTVLRYGSVTGGPVLASLIEWYRPRGAAAAGRLADTMVAVAFDGLRVRPPS